MEDEIEISQEDLNNEMKKLERREYYEDKLLELKMKSFLDTYKMNHVVSKYRTELDELNKEKEALLKEKENLVNKISEIKEEKNNYEDAINNLENQILQEEKNSKNLDALIINQQEYAKKLSTEDNLLNHIIKVFPNSFKKNIYEICSKNVTEALNTDKTSNKKDAKTEPNLMVVSGEREEFVSKGEENESEEQETDDNNADNNNNANRGYNPMMGYNGQFMMYPMYMMQHGIKNNNINMPTMPNMQNMNGNPFYFFPFPMTNMPQNNNINKNK